MSAFERRRNIKCWKNRRGSARNTPRATRLNSSFNLFGTLDAKSLAFILSILHHIKARFQHLILKCDQAFLALPPVRGAVLRRGHGPDVRTYTRLIENPFAYPI